MATTWRWKQCPHCEKGFIISEGEGKIATINEDSSSNFLKTDKNQIIEGIELILESSQDAYAKKIALFNLIKNLEVGGIEPSEKQRINCLLEGKLYNEISKEKMKEYKKLTIKDFSKS